jgi:hypothetical protein
MTELSTHAPERQQTSERPPIVDGGDYMEYMGVRVPKARERTSPRVPEKSQGIVEHPDRMSMQQAVARAIILGQPLVLEGGSDIGKSTVIRDVAADIRAGVFTITCSSHTNEFDHALWGTEEKPGQLIEALTPKEGQINIIILEELNRLYPGLYSMWHDILDRLEKGESVETSTGRILQLDPQRTIVIATSNPATERPDDPKRQYDPDFIRRFVYQRYPDKLPTETRETILATLLFGENSPFQQIKGINQLIHGIIEFAEKAQIIEQQTARVTSSPLFPGGLTDITRLAKFVQQFHDGELNLPDITTTFKKALQYYYANRLHPDHGRREILALIDTTLEGGHSEQHNVDEEWE